MSARQFGKIFGEAGVLCCVVLCCVVLCCVVLCCVVLCCVVLCCVVLCCVVLCCVVLCCVVSCRVVLCCVVLCCVVLCCVVLCCVVLCCVVLCCVVLCCVVLCCVVLCCVVLCWNGDHVHCLPESPPSSQGSPGSMSCTVHSRFAGATPGPAWHAPPRGPVAVGLACLAGLILLMTAVGGPAQGLYAAPRAMPPLAPGHPARHAPSHTLRTTGLGTASAWERPHTDLGVAEVTQPPHGVGERMRSPHSVAVNGIRSSLMAIGSLVLGALLWARQHRRAPTTALGPMSMAAVDGEPSGGAVGDPPVRKRRVRYSGRYPKKFEEKYKELRGDAGMKAHVEAKGGTAAGTHRPIAVPEILDVLRPRPGQVYVDCTLGYGGHAALLLPRLAPGGRLIGLDADSAQLAKTEARLRGLGFGPDVAVCVHSNYAALATVALERAPEGVDLVLADLGLSSMQIDDPERGMSFKTDGPLDMRLDPTRGAPASERLAQWDEAALAELLRANADEPRADGVARAVCARQRRRPVATTAELAAAVREGLPRGLPKGEVRAAQRRVFQAVRIAVNDEFGKLDALLRVLPYVLRPGGRAAILTFHSGEDRRVKRAFRDGLREGVYSDVAKDIIRPSWDEQRANPRAKSAKLRWAQRA